MWTCPVENVGKITFSTGYFYDLDEWNIGKC